MLSWQLPPMLVSSRVRASWGLQRQAGSHSCAGGHAREGYADSLCREGIEVWPPRIGCSVYCSAELMVMCVQGVVVARSSSSSRWWCALL